MGLYGQVMNVTINPIEAPHNSGSLIGLALHRRTKKATKSCVICSLIRREAGIKKIKSRIKVSLFSSMPLK